MRSAMTPDQVAAALNVSVWTVKKDLTSALSKIRRAIRRDPQLRVVFVRGRERACR